MVIEKVTGCTCDSLTVDDVQEIELADIDRRNILTNIGKYIGKMDLESFKELIDGELKMYSTEEDLEYVDEFYSMLLVDKTIKPLQQFDNMLPIDEEYLLIELRVSLANFITNMHTDDLNWLLQQIAEALGKSEYLFYCEQCFDSVYKYTLEI